MFFDQLLHGFSLAVSSLVTHKNPLTRYFCKKSYLGHWDLKTSLVRELSISHSLFTQFVLCLYQTVDANSNHEITSKAECCHIKEAVNVSLSTKRNDDIKNHVVIPRMLSMQVCELKKMITLSSHSHTSRMQSM